MSGKYFLKAPASVAGHLRAVIGAVGTHHNNNQEIAGYHACRHTSLSLWTVARQHGKYKKYTQMRLRET